ncbi:MAG: galactokinase, partial [Bacteroidetes bacterium]|nr:galactokinase [Bacteroidota bacterium]
SKIFEESYSFELDGSLKRGVNWANYLVGVVDQFAKSGHKLHGFNCVFAGDIPIGAGMSSSAAVEAGLAFTLSELNGIDISRTELARMAQLAENEFVGVKCGIMDQFANLLSKGGSALHLDCRSLDFDYIPFDGKDLKFVLCDTGVKHQLASSEYNLRRKQCEEGVSVVRCHAEGVRSLRDVTPEMLQAARGKMDPVVYKRCKYVLEENARVETACHYLRCNDYDRFGQLLYESHDGLRNEFEVSCTELNILVDAAAGIRGVLGSRMMGGGFGGCSLNLVRNDSVEDFSEQIRSVYSCKTGKVPRIYECELTVGTGIVSDSEPTD